jgi:hypothetical protein
MAQDPSSHVASWLTPAGDDRVGNDVFAASAEVDDPIFALIVEFQRLEAEASEVQLMRYAYCCIRICIAIMALSCCGLPIWMLPA